MEKMLSVTTNHAATERQLILEVIDDKLPKSKMGMVDPDLMVGKNKLYCIKDPKVNHWFFKYDKGILPQSLKDRFTSFKLALKHAELYFRTRNIQIKEVKD